MKKYSKEPIYRRKASVLAQSTILCAGGCLCLAFMALIIGSAVIGSRSMTFPSSNITHVNVSSSSSSSSTGSSIFSSSSASFSSSSASFSSSAGRVFDSFCTSKSCFNGGTCTPGINSSEPFTCQCLPNVLGYQCEIPGCSIPPYQLIDQKNVSCWIEFNFGFIPSYIQPFLNSSEGVDDESGVLLASIGRPFYFRIVDNSCTIRNSSAYTISQLSIADHHFVFPDLLLYISSSVCDTSLPLFGVCVQVKNESTSDTVAILSPTALSQCASDNGFTVPASTSMHISSADSDYANSTWVVLEQAGTVYLGRWSTYFDKCYGFIDLSQVFINTTFQSSFFHSIQFDDATSRLYVQDQNTIYYIQLNPEVTQPLVLSGVQVYLSYPDSSFVPGVSTYSIGLTGLGLGNSGYPWITSLEQGNGTGAPNVTIWSHYSSGASVVTQNETIFGYDFPDSFYQPFIIRSSPWGQTAVIAPSGYISSRNCQLTELSPPCSSSNCMLPEGTCFYNECRCRIPPYLGLYAPQDCFIP